MTKYIVSKLAYDVYSITEIDVISETENFVQPVNGARKAKDTNYDCICDTIQEAIEKRKQIIDKIIQDKKQKIKTLNDEIEQLTQDKLTFGV
jgi:hypothetical protein